MTAARPPVEERKVVTVLFCDLVGFTSASENADPEDVRARLRPYHARMRMELERFGGTVEKFIGDAVMAVFGAPATHEDDPERAVRAGFGILAAIADLNKADPALDLAVRIGINTGEAVVSLGARPEAGEGMVAGNVVNTASRLQTIAPIGVIVVGEETYRATIRQVEYEEMPPAQVKGKANPVALWKAISARSRISSDASAEHPTPMVGRELELSILTRAFERAVRDRSMEFVTIVGEPGVGKTRLMAELYAHIDRLPDQLVSWRQGRCLPYGEGITFWALIEIVKAHAGILDSDPIDSAEIKLNAVLPGEGMDRTWLRERLGPLVGLGGSSPVGQDEAFKAWRTFLESVAERGPAVFVFEDLHWADEAMLAFLEHVMDWSQGVPMLVLATARPELYERKPTWGGGKRNAAIINLSPLSDAETIELASLLLDSGDLPDAIKNLIVDGAGGNPLYAEEYVRLLHDHGLLIRRGSRLELGEVTNIPGPASIHALIAARLDTLPTDRKELLQDASVIGKDFWAGAVVAMGDRDPAEVTESLHELSRKELVRMARTSTMAGEAEYSFWHLLVRDVAYSQIPRAARADKHRRAATWIEAQAGERIAEVAEVLAYHYNVAIDLVRAGGGGPDQVSALEGRARQFLLLAGERALGLDGARAESSFARALALTPLGHQDRAQVLEHWAASALQTGRLQEAETALNEAVAISRERADRLSAGRALIALAFVHSRKGIEGAEDPLGDAIELLELEPSGPELVSAYTELAASKADHGANAEAVASADRALALAAQLGLGESPRALGFRGLFRCMDGDAGGIDDLRRALQLALDQGGGRDSAVLYANLAYATSMVEGPASALVVAREGVEFAERRGLSEIALQIACSSLQTMYDTGDWDEALAGAPALTARAEAAGAVDEVLARSTEITILAQRGEGAVAAARAEFILSRVQNLTQIQYNTIGMAAVALAWRASGQLDRARSVVSELEQVPSVRRDLGYVAVLPELVRTAIACGDVSLAESLLRDIEGPFPVHRNAVMASKAAIAEAVQGGAGDAANFYAESARGWRAMGNIPELAFALLGQGRCSLGRGTDAEPALAEAREIFTQLGAKPELAETAKHLASGPSRRRSIGGR